MAHGCAMDWQQKIFRYCERGGDAGFWAEPLNAISNGAFTIAAVIAAVLLLRRPVGERGGIAEWLLIALTFIIGVGSFLFHTYATLWAARADTIPIGIFMFAYVAYALRRYLALHWIFVLLGLGLFWLSLQFAGSIQCRAGLFAVTGNARHCLNGTMTYAPALVAMIVIGAFAAFRRQGAAPYLFAAAGVFFISMLFRTVDWETCSRSIVAGRTLGTHFLWHVFNGLALFILLLAAIRHGQVRPKANGGVSDSGSR
ncbi:ceramidase domain-containing protein [Hyphomicrobium sulfonivorans]|uniref:ceramidase domain-containing protein n=1 Tax=Hyphomicrobium sulfonivorans TaxID=121290 RepID=UPI001FE67FCE|nr:ceramidase domain-containing protein [Hyphomicrobium sulfonivorans]